MKITFEELKRRYDQADYYVDPKTQYLLDKYWRLRQMDIAEKKINYVAKNTKKGETK